MTIEANERGTTPRFRLAIVGAGLITRSVHLPTALSLPEIEVYALVDPVISRAAELADEYGIRPLIASQVDDLIGNLDGTIIATPNHTHREVAVPLLEAGISTFIEKPLATTVEDGQAIVDAALRGNAKVALGYSSDPFASLEGRVRCSGCIVVRVVAASGI